MDYQRLGRQVRALRLRQGMTQERLAEAVGLSVPYVSRIECGSRKASLEALEQIAAALGIPVVRLLSDAQTQSA